MPRFIGNVRILFLCGACLALLCACTEEAAKKSETLPEVGVMETACQQAPLFVELPGRVTAYRKAEVRPQVSGIILKQLFTEGSVVTEGQPLYKIDPAIYESAVASARATLASAEARANAARLARDRSRNLLREKAVSDQAWEDAQAEWLKAKADLDLARAGLRRAEIELGYTDVRSPISGKIGKSSVTPGALVTANQAEPVARIQQFDPVYVDIVQSSSSLLRLRERYAAGGLVRPDSEGLKVRLFLETGKPHPVEGDLQFSDISVDEDTGTFLVRAVFPNPDYLLLPGMFVTARLSIGTEQAAILVPQIAVRRSAKGVASVYVVADGGKVEDRIVTAEERVGNCWVVAKGLAAGEKVVVRGGQRLRDGVKVKVVAVSSTAELAAVPVADAAGAEAR